VEEIGSRKQTDNFSGFFLQDTKKRRFLPPSKQGASIITVQLFNYLESDNNTRILLRRTENWAAHGRIDSWYKPA
jgi:hypothetical protein